MSRATLSGGLEMSVELKVRLYLEGLYAFPVPPVATRQWTNKEWIAFIDRYGRWIIPAAWLSDAVETIVKVPTSGKWRKDIVVPNSRAPLARQQEANPCTSPSTPITSAKSATSKTPEPR